MDSTGTARQVLAQRRAAGDWTEDEILVIARRGDFVVWRYSEQHEQLRQLTRRMRQEGKLVLASQGRKQFTYRTSKEK